MSDVDEVALLRKQFYETALQAGIKIISDDTCCRLLAWLYVYGGGNEWSVYNAKFNAAVMYAQKRLNLLGGETPDKLIFLMNEYIEGITDFLTPPEWVPELENEYKIPEYRKSRFNGGQSIFK